MNLIDSAYKIPKAMENRLKFWLSMDAWDIDDAAQIITGIDPDMTIKPSIISDNTGSRMLGAVTLFNGCQLPSPPLEKTYRLVGGEFFDSLELVKDENFDDFPDDAEIEWRREESNALKTYFDKCTSIARLFNNPSTCPTSPKEWIERALSKKIAIPWLALAKERGLLPNNMTEEFESMSKSNASTDKCYAPSNVKREARKLETQKMYLIWQKAYRDLEKTHKHRHMSDVWYSQQIAKLDIAKGRNADTIRGHMKP